MAAIDQFRCTVCRKDSHTTAADGSCPACGGVLLLRDDLPVTAISRASLADRVPSLWRYAELLPDVAPVTLGEGLTPLLRSRTCPPLLVKDERASGRCEGCVRPGPGATSLRGTPEGMVING